jgi:hypothetical protein
MIESQNLGVRGFEGVLSGQNKVTAILSVNVDTNLVNKGQDTATSVQYAADKDMRLEGPITSSTLTAVARDLESTANINTTQSTHLRGVQSATVGGEISSTGSAVITSEGNTSVPANIHSKTLDVQGNHLEISGDTNIDETLRAKATENLKSTGNHKAKEIQYYSDLNMTLSGKQNAENLVALALGNLQSDADIHTTTISLEGVASSTIGGTIDSETSVKLSSQGKQSVSATIHANAIATEGRDVDLSWNVQAERVAVAANNNLSHFGNTTSDHIYLQSNTGQLGGHVTSDHQVRIEIDGASTNWNAVLNKLSVSGNNLTLGGELTAEEVFLGILDKLHIKDSASIQVLKAHAKTLLKEGSLDGKVALFDIEDTATLQGSSVTSQKVRVNIWLS